MSDQIVKNKSKAYGYNYASLADIVNQGFELPVMTTRVVEGQTFIFWKDDKSGEWLQGAPVIVPDMKGMNAAQAMGSALTYARRYTAQMALGLACDDDSKLETKEPNSNRPAFGGGGNKIDFAEVRSKIKSINNIDELLEYWASLNLSPKQQDILKTDFTKRKAEIGGE